MQLYTLCNETIMKLFKPLSRNSKGDISSLFYIQTCLHEQEKLSLTEDTQNVSQFINNGWHKKFTIRRNTTLWTIDCSGSVHRTTSYRSIDSENFMPSHHMSNY